VNFKFNVDYFVTNGSIFAYTSFGKLFIYDSDSKLIKKIEVSDDYKYGYFKLAITEDKIVASKENDIEVFNFIGESLGITNIPFGIASLTSSTITGISTNSADFPSTLISSAETVSYKTAGEEDIISFDYDIKNGKIVTSVGTIRQIGGVGKDNSNPNNIISEYNGSGTYLLLNLSDNVSVKSFSHADDKELFPKLMPFKEDLSSNEGNYICNCKEYIGDTLHNDGTTVRWMRPVMNPITVSSAKFTSEGKMDGLFVLSDAQNKNSVLGSGRDDYSDDNDYGSLLQLNKYNNNNGSLISSKLIDGISAFNTSMIATNESLYIIGGLKNTDTEIRKYSPELNLTSKALLPKGTFLNTYQYKNDIYILFSTEKKEPSLEVYKIVK
jgi:hypothetical protein